MHRMMIAVGILLISSVSGWAGESAVVMPIGAMNKGQIGQGGAIKDQAQAKLAFIRRQLAIALKDSGLLSKLFDSKNKLQQTIMDDIDAYLLTYGELAISAEAYEMAARLYQKHNSKKAIVSYLHLLRLYPGSTIHGRADKAVRKLLAEEDASFIKVVNPVLAAGKAGGSGFARQWLDLLLSLSTLSGDDIDSVIAKSCRAFLLRYPDHPGADMVQKILADHAQQDSNVAIYQYRKLLSLYPHSLQRANSLLTIANIQRLHMKKYEDAVVSYKTVIHDYPSSAAARSAYESMAITYEKNIRDYPAAVAINRQIVNKYEAQAVVQRALKRMADIQKEKLHEYAKAIASYRKLADMFEGEQALNALRSAAHIAAVKVKDYKLAIEINEQIVRDSSDEKIAGQAMLDIAGIYEYRLKSKPAAIKAYERVVREYPDSRQAKTAAKALARLTAKPKKGGGFPKIPVPSWLPG